MRTIIQIAATPNTHKGFTSDAKILALCNDGTLWEWSENIHKECLEWTEIDPIPQD